jgi:hypothetical protein
MNHTRGGFATICSVRSARSARSVRTMWVFAVLAVFVHSIVAKRGARAGKQRRGARTQTHGVKGRQLVVCIIVPLLLPLCLIDGAHIPYRESDTTWSQKHNAKSCFHTHSAMRDGLRGWSAGTSSEKMVTNASKHTHSLRTCSRSCHCDGDHAGRRGGVVKLLLGKTTRLRKEVS